MKKTIKLVSARGTYVCPSNSNISICKIGLSRYFNVERHELEHEMWLTVSDKPFEGSSEEYVNDGDVEIDGKGVPSIYMYSWTEDEFKQMLGIPHDKRAYFVHVAFEVYDEAD